MSEKLSKEELVDFIKNLQQRYPKAFFHTEKLLKRANQAFEQIKQLIEAQAEPSEYGELDQAIIYTDNGKKVKGVARIYFEKASEEWFDNQLCHLFNLLDPPKDKRVATEDWFRNLLSQAPMRKPKEGRIEIMELKALNSKEYQAESRRLFEASKSFKSLYDVQTYLSALVYKLYVIPPMRKPKVNKTRLKECVDIKSNGERYLDIKALMYELKVEVVE